MVSQLDLSEYKSASGAAKATGEQIRDIAAHIFDQDPDLEVTVEKRDGNWIVNWEGGPFEWAIKLTGGEPISISAEPEITGFYESNGFDVECKNRSTLVFYDR